MIFNYFKNIFYLLLVVLFGVSINCYAQELTDTPVNKYIKGGDFDVYGISKCFIENVGQYGERFEKYPQMGKILYAYEGFDVPVLFTTKGVIYLHRKLKGPTLTEIEKEERRRSKKKKEEEIEELRIIDCSITMQWNNANNEVEIITEGQNPEYHTYGFTTTKARAFKKLTYKNLYPGIDLVYTFKNEKKIGFEYYLFVKPHADLAVVKMLYGGDVKRVRKDNKGNLILKSIAGKTTETFPVTYYGEILNASPIEQTKVKSGYSVSGKVVSFDFPENYNHEMSLIIDPFVTGTTNLTGTGANAGIAKDVDFDYAGNVYVTGGGNGSTYKLAKFDAAGVLQWTFSGSLTIPAWTFGTYYGGWVVDKNNGNIYLGQGFAPSGGHRVIRINTTGVYDNYITTANGSFLENWKMYWSCNSGSPQLLIAGGGTNSNINFGVIAPPSTTITSVNVTGIPYTSSGWAQDIADVIIDPANNALYTVYGSLYGTPSLANKIYKNTPPYSGATVAWNVPSGYTTIQEIANRPYLVGPEIDNSCNVFAINSSYLFFWDGKNLKAINKTTGSTVGTPLTVSATPLMAGGIIADECNNIFVGSGNGTIKVYSFNGSTFDDASKPDITIPGFGSSAIYDLAFYEAQKVLYASGNGFVGSFDVSNYNCVTNVFSLNVVSSCGTLSATATVNPVPPSGSTVTYVLFNGLTQLASNTTGIFSGLTPNITYTVKATVNQACSGVVTTTTFSLPGPAIVSSITNTLCGNNTGSVSVIASGGVSPYTYSKDGVTFQASNSFTSLAAGIYTITVKDANNCSNTISVTITNSNGPTVTFTKTDAVCGTNTGTLTATGSGGTAPLTYSINGTNFQTNNFFTGISPGNYTLTVKDANGCVNVKSFTITNSPAVTVTAVPTTTYCNSTNGIITISASGGTAPLQYSINGNTYQSGSVFSSLAAGLYTVTVKDANGCLTTTSVNIANSPAPTVTASAITASCNNANGSITATGTGGVVPYQYSVNGTTFQSSNFFGGLTSGSYVVTIKDANNCTNTVSVTVNSTNGPQVTASSTTSSCNTNNGTITALGNGGTGLLQYSINGVSFQTSTLFSGLAAGVYTLYVRDANGCLGGNIIVVANTASPSITVSVTPTACSLSNGTITATGTGGTPPYQYSINNGTSYQAGATFNSLATGPYVVIIKDANGCTSAAATIMTNVAGLAITATNISSACSSNNGSITAIGTGGAAPLQYSINGVTYQSGSTFNSLSGGNYTIWVKDNNGCIAIASTTINTVQAPSITATATNATCASNNAVITATGTGGTSPLLYSINGSTYQSGNIFLNVAPGTYTVYVKDAANCIQTTTVTVTTSGTGPGISAFTVVAKPAYLCNGDLGKITNPKVNGATCNTCTYSLNFGAYVPHATQLFLNVSPGTYTVTAKDVNGCTKTILATVGVGVPSTASAIATGTACNTSNGTIQLTGIGPNTPYHAFNNTLGGPWIDFDPTYTYTGLAPGTYEIILSDDESFDAGPPIDPGGCLDTIYVTVPAIGGPSLTATQTGGSCNQSNGTINAVGAGGTGTLTYSLDGFTFQASGSFTGLAAGNYTITVMDGTGCTNSINVAVTNTGAPLVSTVTTPASCGLANGGITITGSGGTAPLQYSINGTVYQSSNVFTGLAAGTYTVRVGDAGACITTATAIVSNSPRPTVTAFSIAASCNMPTGAISCIGSSGASPYQYSINGTTFQSSNQFIGLTAGFYTVTIKDVNGCTNTTGLTINNLLAPQMTLTPTPATCLSTNGTITTVATGGTTPYQYSLNGVSYQASNLFTALGSGSYTVYVKDFTGCIATKNLLITSPNVPQSVSATITNTSCGNNNGSIVAAATGGIAPLSYSINGSTFQAGTSFTLLAAGSYPLTVRDANLCTKTLNVNLINLPGPTLTATATLSSCFANDGTITATGTGGTGALTYSKNGTVFQSSPVFTSLAPGNYTITVRDSKLCTNTANITVGKVVGPVISVTSSPSGCGDTILVSQTGGTSALQYNINALPYQSNNAFPCQPPGIYMVRVIDANGCKDSMSFSLGSPLPVELLYFTGIRKEKYNILQWQTASERNNDYFTIEKSNDAIDFEMLGTVMGSGNSNIIKSYSFVDEHPYNIINYYRLKQTDFDGKFSYSSIISLINTMSGSFSCIYNSSTDEIILVSNTSENEWMNNIIVFDSRGRIITEKKFKGSFYSWKANGMAKGVYSLQLIGKSEIKEFKVVIN